MKKFPFVKQHDLKDCGVACLSMIIEFYNGHISIEKLRDLTHTDKNGTTAYHLIETAKKIGFNAYGLKVNDLKNIKLPCIAHVTINNSFNHYVVIYEINYEKEQLLIADPASRIKKISFNEFNKIFNNIVLIFIKIKKLPLYNKNASFISLIVNILKKYKAYFIKIVIMSLFITILSIITSFYVGLMINNLKIFLFQICFIFLNIYIIKNVLEFFRNIVLFKVHKKIDTDLTNGIFESIISLPYRYFKNRTTGEIITRINDLNIINETIIKTIVTIILDLTLSIASMIVLLIINIKLFSISLLIFIIYILVVLLFSSKLKVKLENIKEDKSKLNSYIVESINAFETIKGLGVEDNIIKHHHDINNKLIDNNFKYEKLFNYEYFLKNMINDIGLCLLVLLGSLLVINNNLDIGLLITCSYMFTYFISPIKNIIELTKDLKDSKLSYNRINELLFNDKKINKYYHLDFNNIKFNNLHYSYDDISNILSNINLQINNNEKIMIVGTSGSGKSTWLKLLKKYYPVDDNEIFIDNVDINKISEKEINDNIAYVSQNEILFTDTLYNNLTLNRKIKHKKINKVIKNTYIDFMDDLKLNMFLEENGFNLSGGQKARIILARSLLNNFRVLILDEIFNEMDTNLERKILKTLFKTYKDKIIIVVSHRNNNIDLFDRVIELSDGIIKNNIKKHF